MPNVEPIAVWPPSPMGVNTAIPASEAQLRYSCIHTPEFFPYISCVPRLSGVRLIPVARPGRELPGPKFARVKYLRVRLPACLKLAYSLLSQPPLYPDQTLDAAAAMAPSDELEYLKSLVNQLNEKIKALESKAKAVVKPKTPAQQLRTILIGPPGSGSSQFARLL